MLLSKEPPFVKRLGSIWQSMTHIPDLQTLKIHMADSATFVAFDLEGHVARVSEAGLASLRISAASGLQCLATDELRSFYEQNEVQAYTISVWEERKKKTREAIKYGQQKTVKRNEIGTALHDALSAVAQKWNTSSIEQCSTLILVGYDMYTEFDWISKTCPSFLTRFKYWVDVQEIVEECCGARPSLCKMLSAMNIPDRNSRNSHGHRASNDAVRMLAVLSTLVSTDHSAFEYLPTTGPKLCSTFPRNWRNFPFKARITTKDGSTLPSYIQTPRALATHFALYYPTAVLINSRAAAVTGVRVWWMCVPSKSLLEKLATDFNGMVFDRKELAVEVFVAPWSTKYSEKEIQPLAGTSSSHSAASGATNGALHCAAWP